MRTRGAEALGMDHQRCGQGSVGRRVSAGIVGKVYAVATTSYPGAFACRRRGVNVLFTVEVRTHNHAMGSSVLAQTIINITW